MDKVLDDLIRQRKATEASKDQRKKASPKTPRGSAGGRFFSSPRTPMSAEKYAPSISPLSTPRGSGAKSPHNRLMGAKYTPPYRSVSPRTPSSPKTPTNAEKMPTPSTSPVGCVKTSTDKDLSPSVAKAMEFDASEITAKTTCISTMVTSTSSTTKCTPLTQALMSEPMVSSHLSDNSLFNKPRNSLPQVTTHPVSNTATATTTTASIGAPASSSLSTNSSAHAATHQHFAVAQTVGGQRPSLSLFSHQNSGVGQGSPQAGIARGVTQVHLPNSPLAQPAQSPHAQSPLSQPAHSPMTHTSQSPMSHTVHSPMTQLSQSPLSQPVHSPMSQTTQSPISQPIQSPMSQHSQSPMTQVAHSPMAQPAQSPMSQPAQSPTAQSPLAQPAQSPSASQSPISQVSQLRGTVQQNIPGAKPRLTLSGKPRVSITDKPKLSMANKPRLSLASPLTVSTSTIQSHLSSTPTLQAQLNQAVQHQVLQQHLSQTTQQQQQSQLVQQQRAQAISQQQINQAVAQHQMVSVTEPAQAQAQMSQQQQLTQQQQQQLAQQLQLNQQSQAQLNQQHLAQQQQQLAQQQLSQQQLQQLSQQQVQTPQLTLQQQQQLTLALAQQQLNQQQSGTQSMSPQMAQQLNQLIKQQRIQLTLRPQRAAQQQQQQQLAQVKAQQLVSTQQLVQQQLAQINAQQMAQTTLQPQLTQSTVQTSQTTAQPNVTTASPAPKIWSKPSAQHQLLQAALSQVPQNQTSLNQMIQAVKSRMNPATHPQLFKSISQLTQTSQPQSQGAQLHTLTNPSPSLSSLVMASQSPTTSSTPTHSASAVSFPSSDNVQNTSQASGHLTQVVYNTQASLVTNPSHTGPPPTTSVAQATVQQPSSAITQPSLLVRKEEAIPAQQTQLGIQRNESTDYKLSIFTQASTPSASVTTAESVTTAQFVSQAQVTRTDASHLSRQLPNLGRKSSLTGESGGLSTQLTASETPTSQTGMIVCQSSNQVPTTQTRFVPSNLLQPSTESTLVTRERFVAPSDAIASNQERFTLATMNQAINRAAHPAVSQASELSSPSGRERLTLASMLQTFDLAGLSQQEKQTLSTLTQSRDLSFLQNCTSDSEGTTGASQQFSTINKAASNVGFSQSHMQMGESQVSPVSQSYIMPSYGVSAMIGKPPPPYSVAIAEKALSSMRTSMAGRKDTNIVTQLPPATVTSVTSATDKTVAFVKKPETSMPSTTVAVWVTTPNTSSEVGSNIASSHSSVVTSQLGINSQPAAAAAQVSVQKISLQQSQQSAVTGELNKALTEKDDKQTLDLVNTSLSAVRTAISNQMYPQTVSKDNLLIRKNLLGFSLNKPSTASDMSSVTTSGTSSIASNNSLLQHMLGTSSSDHLTTTTAHLIPSTSTHELNLQKMSLSSASVTSNSNFGALTSSLSHSQPQPSTTPSTPSTRPRLTAIAALLNIDSSAKTQAEQQLRQLSMAGISTDGSSAISNLGQTLSIISPVTSFSTAVTKTVNPSSITTASQVTMVPALTSKPNPSSQATTNTADSSQTEQKQTPVSES